MRTSALTLALLLPACTPEMEDNSLESVQLTGIDEEGTTELTGQLAATAGADAGDWELSVGETSFNYHSPSHADLSAFAGTEVELLVEIGYTVPPTVVLSDADGVAFVSSSEASFDGSSVFGRAVWTAGEVIGQGVIMNEYDEPNDVRFVEVLVTDDDGEQVVLPGEPTRITLDGVSYRFTVTTAYEAVDEAGAKCGPPDILAVEVIRTEQDPGDFLTRPDIYRAPMGMCG